MSSEETISFSLEVNVEAAEINVRRLLATLNRAVHIVRRLGGGNEDLEMLMEMMNRSIRVANQLRLALYALQMARMSAGDPLAWAFAGTVVVSTAINVTDDFGSYG